MIKIIKTKYPWILQFIKFGIIGAFNTFLALGIYELLVYFNLNPQLANFVAFVISVINAYFWNLSWVFKGKNKNNFTIVKFFILYGATYLLSAGLLHLWIEILHISKYIAPMISLFITIPTNFLFSKFWVFKSKN